MSGMDGIAAFSNGGNQNQAIHSHMVSHLQCFDEPNPDQIYNLTAGMEMVSASYPSRNHLQQQNSTSVLWRGFFNNSNNKPGTSGGSDSGGGPGPSTSNKEFNVRTSSDDDQFYHHDLTANEALVISPPLAWTNHHNRLANVDDPYHSLRSCVFPCEGNEKPSQGLSLSLSSSDPSRVTLQSFEPRQHSSSGSHLMQGQYSHVTNSRYLGPAQELLSELSCLGLKKTEDNTSKIINLQKTNDQDDQISDVTKQSLYSLDLLELQIRKTKLIQMLEEVDRRYKHYSDQMKAVASSFEAVAGNGAASVYFSMASRAMSRHFRCLRDGIATQLKATKTALEEKNTAAPGYTMKGETPRLRILDQKLRQQKALQQMSMMEAHPWRPQRGLPERSVSALRAWLFEHFLHPYPTDVDKHILSRQTGLSRSQVSNWFINARVRLWKPMVEEMYSAELKENGDENLDRSKHSDDQRPAVDRTARKDSDALSSMLNNNPSDRNNSYSAMELDFSSYGGGVSSGGVSLTLGLHQHNGNGGVGSSSSSSLFYTRDQMEDYQTIHHQYSLLESDQSQNLPYRNLMGAQLLHDLAG